MSFDADRSHAFRAHLRSTSSASSETIIFEEMCAATALWNVGGISVCHWHSDPSVAALRIARKKTILGKEIRLMQKAAEIP
jgi:hypothetical protein